MDDKSGMADICHVFIDNNVKYTATLNLVDIQSGKNSYYKLQVLEHDDKHNGRFDKQIIIVFLNLINY